MIPGLEPIPLRELHALGSVRDWEFEGQLDELPSLTPVRGSIQAEHRGNILEVSGSAQTIVCLLRSMPEAVQSPAVHRCKRADLAR